jgi:MtN3 and saliva related transmembrane protein
MMTEIIGYLAAIFGTSLMLPQVYKSFKTKQVDDLSMVMLVIYVINCTLWGIYGILLQSNPIIICNLLALVIAIIQMVLKLKYRKR